MVPGVQQELLRAQHRDRGLLRDQRCSFQRGLHDLVSPSVDDTRDEPDGQRLGSGEVARGQGQLGRERLVASYLREAGERTDICCKPDVDFLQRTERIE